MPTAADMMLIQAMTQFGGGLGGMLGRRRQTKQNQSLADLLAPAGAPEDYMDPQQSKLIQAFAGGVPGLAGAVAGGGMQGRQQVGAKRKADASQLQNDQMRQMLKDPQIAAMMKQQMAAQMMPKKPEVIQTNWGVFERGPDGSLKTLTEPPEKKEGKISVSPGTSIYDPETGQVLYTAPKDTKQKTWLSEQTRMGENGVPETRSLIIREDGTSTPVSEWGPSAKAFALAQPVMGKGEQAKWRGKIEETRKSLREFQDIQKMFDPDFLTLVGRGRSTVSDLMSQFNVLDKFPGEKERYEDRNEFFAAVSDRANRYIKEITGAQMSEAEANRLLTAIPNVRDNPDEFSAKLDFVIGVSQSALDQYEKVLWSTNSPDAARSAADMIVRQMLDDGSNENFDEEPSFIE